MTQWDDIASAVKGTTALTEQMKWDGGGAMTDEMLGWP